MPLPLPRRTRRLTALCATALCVTTIGAATLSAAAAPGLGARPVFLVRSDTTTDASVAASAAARAGAPLLYTSPTGLDATTRQYLTNTRPTTVVLVGGPAALDPVVASSVEALGFPTVRAQGDDRAATATALADLVADLPAASGTPGPVGAMGPAGATGPAGASGATTVFRYIDVEVTVPEAATTLADYRASCPAGTHIVNGSVRSLTKNAFYSLGTQYADETGGSSAWVFQAYHMTAAQMAQEVPAVPTGDAVARLRLVCAGA